MYNTMTMDNRLLQVGVDSFGAFHDARLTINPSERFNPALLPHGKMTLAIESIDTQVVSVL